MIEIKETKDDKYEIFLDGSICRNTDAYARKSKIGKFEISSKSKIDSKKIAQQLLSEIPSFVHISLSDLFDWVSFTHSLSLTLSSEKNDSGEYVENGYLDVCISFHPDLTEWSENYTFTQYTNTFKEIWDYKNIVSSKFAIYGDEFPSIYLIFTIQPNFNLTLTELISEFEKTVEEIQKETIQRLDNSLTVISILEVFDFPKGLKVPCEQYLLYFAQFLRDLGINATSNLKEEAGKVLFSVTPTDDVEALDKIREALAVYLHLPSSPIVYDESFAAMRQKQQIENLQHSQRMIEMEFRLSQKVIESQDKIIVQKDTLIDQQREIIEKIRSKSIMIDSAENKEELEEIFEGVKVGKSKFLAEQIGLHLNPATALKTVGKKILGRADENKSVLGLDEKINK